jgi:hypothetical protein
MGEQVDCQTPRCPFARHRARPLTGNPYFGNMVTMKKARVRPTRGSTVSDTNKWEKILAAEGLSMDAGRRRFRDAAGRERDRLVHVGGSMEVEALHEMIVGDNGKVKPKGAGPDNEGNGEGRS